MASNKPSKTSRMKVDSYRGYSIIKVTTSYFTKNIFGVGFDSRWIDRKEVHFTFCKEGDEKRPTQEYNAWTKSIADCKACIDKFIDEDELYFTDEERNKYVYGPNRKCQWAYGYDSLVKIMKAHKKADRRMKRLYEDRLTDANFHHYCGLLYEERYDEFENDAAHDFPIVEKMEVYIKPLRKGVDANQVALGLQGVIDNYLRSIGVKDIESTTVKVIEER